MAVLLAGFWFGGVSLANYTLTINTDPEENQVQVGTDDNFKGSGHVISNLESWSEITLYAKAVEWYVFDEAEITEWSATISSNWSIWRIITMWAENAVIRFNFALSCNNESAVACVGGKWYTTLADAIASATDWETVLLLRDITLTGNQWIDKSISIDLNSHKITWNSYYIVFDWNITAKISSWDISTSSYTYVQNSADVTFENLNYVSSTYWILAFSSVVTLKNVNFTWYVPVYADNSQITIESWTYNWSFFAIENLNWSNIMINDWTFSWPESAVHLQNGWKITINSWNFSSSDNCVLRTQWNEWLWKNEIIVNWWTYNGHITSEWYIACGIYVANDDTVTVNWWTFNIKDWVWIVSRWWTTTLWGDVSFNFSFGEKSFWDKWKVWDARIVVPVWYELVMDVAASYPWATPTFVTINNLTGTYLVANTTPDYYVVSIKDWNTVVPLTLTKDWTTAKIAEAPQITEWYQWYNWEETGPYSFNSAITDNVTLTSRINQYTVSFNANAEWVTNPVSQEINHWEKAIEPEIENAWNILLWWFNGDDKFDFESPVTSNLELTAKWEAMTLSWGAKIDDETDEWTWMVVEADVPATETDASAVQSSNSTATVQWEVELNVYNDANWDWNKDGNPILTRVNFTSPVLVRIPVNSWSSAKVKVKHNGDSTFGTVWLTTSSTATCDDWVSNVPYNGGDIAVTSWYVKIYTCSASTFVAYTEVTNPTSSSSTSWWGGGGGWSSRTSALDDTKATTWNNAKLDGMKADETKLEENNDGDGAKTDLMIDVQAVEKFGQEQIDAYKWALENGITTMKTVEDARLDEPLTRAELAKMMVVYIQKVLEKSPVVTWDVNYPDVKVEEIWDLVDYVKLAYQYQIMWINADGTPIELFNPHGIVSRWEYATVFSRVLFGAKFNKEGADFYTNHLEALKTAWILTNMLPTIQEMRGWVMLMMYRSSQNGEAIEKVANSTEEIVDEAKAEEIVSEETVNVSDEEKSEGWIDTEETTKDSTEESVSDESSETPVNTAEATTWDALSE